VQTTLPSDEGLQQRGAQRHPRATVDHAHLGALINQKQSGCDPAGKRGNVQRGAAKRIACANFNSAAGNEGSDAITVSNVGQPAQLQRGWR
jgi:hypothetical protein